MSHENSTLIKVLCFTVLILATVVGSAQSQTPIDADPAFKRPPGADNIDPGAQKRVNDAAEERRRASLQNDAFVQYLRSRPARTEREARAIEFNVAIHVEDYDKVFELGNEFLKTEPQLFYVIKWMAQCGTEEILSGKFSHKQQTLALIQQGLSLLAGKKVTERAWLSTLAEAEADLTFNLGAILTTDAPAQAISPLIKTVKSEVTRYKGRSFVYTYLGAALSRQVRALEVEYANKYADKRQTRENGELRSRIQQLKERAIDAYARAVASSTSPDDENVRVESLSRLTRLYRALHDDSEAGLSELIATVLMKPLPE